MKSKLKITMVCDEPITDEDYNDILEFLSQYGTDIFMVEEENG